ncbi:MAG TPA: hypothetical protein PLL02_00975 [Bacteroidales bacterium]|nr:hypothetical protein [Bacteroidales bacterium]
MWLKAIEGIVKGIAQIFESQSKENREAYKRASQRTFFRSLNSLFIMIPIIAAVLLVIFSNKKEN